MGSIKGRSRVGIATVVGGAHPPTPPRHIEWVRLALEDPTVSSALRILGEREPTWSELYHLFELIEAHIGRPVSAAGWLSKSQRRRFRQTANSRRAVGEQARHGVDYEPPAKPMTLDDARVMARKITERFLNSVL